MEFSNAPIRGEPRLGHQEEHRFAAAGRLVERTLPAFARHNAALRSRSRKTSFQPSPSSQSRRATASALLVARMAQKNARHAKSPRGNYGPKASVMMLAAVVTIQHGQQADDICTLHCTSVS